MTARELIRHIRQQGIGDSLYVKLTQTDLIVKAIEKQIARKPDYEGNDAKCPVCEHEFENNVNDWGCAYCQDCGQALEWGDE